MKTLLIIFGSILIALGLLAGIVAAMCTQEWPEEKNARVRANITSSINSLAQNENENAGFSNMLANGTKDEYQRIHDQRTSLLLLSEISFFAFMISGAPLLIFGVVIKRKPPTKATGAPPKL